MVLMVSFPIFADNKLKITATKVTVFKPEAVQTDTKRGFCWTNSIAVNRPDAWRCMIGNIIHDPCFALESQDKVVCDANPIKNENGFLLKLTKPLPQKDRVKMQNVSAWIVELADGQICRPYTGSMPVIHRNNEMMAMQYGCENTANGENSGLVNRSIVPGKIWRAKKITYTLAGTELKNIKIQNVAIKKVWQ